MKTVAVVVQDGVEAFGLGCIVEVWGEPYHPEDDNPVFDLRVCAATPGVVRGRSVDVVVPEGLDWAAGADLVAMTSRRPHLPDHPAVLEMLRAAYDGGSDVFAHCSGTFTLGAAGLLDGRECTTHWRYTDLLRRQYPEAVVRPEVLYVHDGTVLTGAGSAAALDASLHLVRDRLGSRHAAAAARRIVIPPHRDGGQAQFVDRPVVPTAAESLAPLLEWATKHLDEDLGVRALARRSALSERTLARRFRQETGMTPHAWVVEQRVRRAEQLLERTDLSVDAVARDVGFGSAATLRHHVRRVRELSPTAYRSRFAV
ncbi:helix-turn-helix domain-containing protein [Phycicoccus sp. BSK3Z-2]|uniref:Helix-turn-helix domain-containing protein n=1 Tax=Phycicoccus avicenniae TaxID=2828860 RepID=A0A941HZX4_9MICO|nr:helix-turn-helix domain-containing protein [Phycicoccus avicenniae]MBR7742716.1 helix-turn-helix domain-containing protein [Phycicoccus avicenniae]